MEDIRLTRILKHHFQPTMDMFGECIEIFLEHGFISAIAHEICHVLESLDYWFYKKHTSSKQGDLEDKIEWFLENPNSIVLSIEDVNRYWSLIQSRIDVYFNKNPTVPNFDDWTGLDTVLLQIRHTQHHIGALNVKLKEAYNVSVSWSGYEE